MTILCRDRAVERAAVPVPTAVKIVKGSLDAAMGALVSGSACARDDVVAKLRLLLACPFFRDVAIKLSRLESLATFTIDAAVRHRDSPLADIAASACLRVLHGAGVDITLMGSLEADDEPLAAAVRYGLFGAAQVLLDASADVNGLSKDGTMAPLFGAAAADSDAGMEWRLRSFVCACCAASSLRMRACWRRGMPRAARL
jgi:hypothetical protein